MKFIDLNDDEHGTCSYLGFWLVVSTSLKNMKVFGLDDEILNRWKTNHVPNEQPDDLVADLCPLKGTSVDSPQLSLW